VSLPGNLETEIKLRVDSLPEILKRLAAIGYTVSGPEVFEQNDVFDTSDNSLRNTNRLLRIRRVADRCTVTFKGPPQEGPHKVREELEFSASDAEAVRLVFERLGYSRTFQYEKYRTEMVAPGNNGVVTVDRTPIGNFLEIESDAATIDRVAAQLGFSKTYYVTKSYGALYLEYCEQNRIRPSDMVFGLLGKPDSTGKKKA
jgi:adenylate cyclase, class 2